MDGRKIPCCRVHEQSLAENENVWWKPINSLEERFGYVSKDGFVRSALTTRWI
jgi:hypothetical protein